MKITETPKKFAVVLSGCGVYDGSEIHEAVSLLAAIDKAGCRYQCFAPDMPQRRTVNHLTHEEENPGRNVLHEAARIARGQIKNLKEFSAHDYDVLVFPGGMGAALNLSNFSEKGAACEICPEVERALNESFAAKIIIGAMCIAPVVLARVLGRHHIKVTLGMDDKMAAEIAKTGALHEKREASGVCVDSANRIVTTPAYMEARSIK